MSQLRRVALTLALAAFALPGGAQAQLRDIITKTVSASSSGAMLRLEFADEGALEISFDRGTIFIDGDAIGSYEAGDGLDMAWRSILGDAMTLEDGILALTLSDWTVPATLAAELADVAREVDAALEEALRDIEIRVDSGGGSVSISLGDDNALLQLLLGSVNHLGILEEALSGLDTDFEIHVKEDVVIPAGSIFEGTLVVIDGTLRIEGGVDGDVVVVGGSLDLRDEGFVTGDVRIAGARVVGNTGEIGGGLVDVLEDERDFESDLRDRLLREVRDEIRSELRDELRNLSRADDSSWILAPFRPVIRGVGGVLEKLISVLILGAIGALFLTFAGENMDVIAETARRAPGRSAMVGFAGSFLLIPVWILGGVALAVSIIGIPVAIAWLPLFPLAAILAAVLGYVAVARNTGEWLADSSFPWTGWIRKSNPLFTLFGGLLGLSFAFIAANLISIVPLLGVVSGLLFVVGTIITLVAIQIGFGAVLLTRAGRKREYYGAYDPDAAWEAAMSVDVGDEDVEGVDDAEVNGEGDDDA